MSEIEFELEQGVATITLSAPDRRNALTPDMAEDLIAAFDRADADASVGAVVVRGAGGSFCAGAHLVTLGAAGADPASPEAYDALGVIYASFARLGTLSVPSISAVQGAAVGAGLNLALATDLRIVARDAKLRSGFLKLGIHPGGGHFVLANRTGGREAAAAMGLFGDTINGERAVELGMAWDAVEAQDVDARANGLARAVAADPELARAAVRTFRLETGPPGVSWEVGVQAERAVQMWSLRRRGTRGPDAS